MEGMLLIDKPSQITSFGVVARVRRVLSEENREQMVKQGQTPPKRVKVGHSGTLDPFATGLMILLVGKSTKKAQEFLKLDKAYEATLFLGAESTTGDPEGEITEQKVEQIPDLKTIEEILRNFKGKIKQQVPQYSAVKIEGRRAYDLARKGIKVEMPTREVEIYDLQILSYEWPKLKISCKVSSGTYIRTLGEDIGRALGVGAYLTELRRTEVGNFKIDGAKPLDSVLSGPISPLLTKIPETDSKSN